MAWVDSKYVIDDEDMTMTDNVSGMVYESNPEAVTKRQPERAKAKAQTKKVPIDKVLIPRCATCSTFTGRGTNAYADSKTCLDCRVVTQTKKDQGPRSDPTTCEHTIVSYAQSSKSTQRWHCEDCKEIIHQEPRADFLAARKVGVVDDTVKARAKVVTVKNGLEAPTVTCEQALDIATQYHAMMKKHVKKVTSVGRREAYGLLGDAHNYLPEPCIETSYHARMMLCAEESGGDSSTSCTSRSTSSKEPSRPPPKLEKLYINSGPRGQAMMSMQLMNDDTPSYQRLMKNEDDENSDASSSSMPSLADSTRASTLR